MIGMAWVDDRNVLSEFKTAFTASRIVIQDPRPTLSSDRSDGQATQIATLVQAPGSR